MPIEVDNDSVASSPTRLRRWRHIRAVAIGLFANHGFGDVSIDDIADAAGVSRRTYFNYFATKAGVLFDPDPEESHQLGELLRSPGSEGAIWLTLTTSLIEYLETQQEVVTARRSILGSDPSLDRLHMLANAHFERSLLEWLEERRVDSLSAHLTAAIALAVVRESFRHWVPDTGYSAFLTSVADGFALAGRGMASAA